MVPGLSMYVLGCYDSNAVDDSFVCPIVTVLECNLLKSIFFREIVILYASFTTRDPGDIHETIANAVGSNIRVRYN